jgi:hypothetical protein
MKIILKVIFMSLLALALLFTAVNAFLFASTVVALITIIPCLALFVFLAYSVFLTAKRSLK